MNLFTDLSSRALIGLRVTSLTVFQQEKEFPTQRSINHSCTTAPTSTSNDSIYTAKNTYCKSTTTANSHSNDIPTSITNATINITICNTGTPITALTAVKATTTITVITNVTTATTNGATIQW